MYLAAVDFEKLGFKTTLQSAAYPQLTWSVLSRLPNVVSVAGVGLAGVWWLMNRREEVTAAEAASPASNDNPEAPFPPSKGKEKP
jgi:hypothetical protein